MSKEQPEGDQHQARYEGNRNKNKEDDANVRIAGVSSKLGRGGEQPGETGRRYQRRSHQAHPMTGEQHEYRALWIVALL
jgi:hypothetical protein